MLVLSRKKNQSIVFPNLDITVEILQTDSNRVRVGVDAPRSVSIVRGELHSADSGNSPTEDEIRKKHDFRSRLNGATLALHLLQRQLDAGLQEDAERTLAKAMDSFAELDRLAAETDSAEVVPDSKNSALVVEDNANERELLAGYLRLCGYEVDCVKDGIDAMLYLEKHPRPEVVLMDMHMPRMDGPKTIDTIRSNPAYAGIKIFAISGSDQEDLNVATGRLGVDKWFQKPLQPAKFAETLRRECVMN